MPSLISVAYVHGYFRPKNLVSIGVSLWNLHAHRYYRYHRPVKPRSGGLGPLRFVITSYKIKEDESTNE